MNSPQSETPPAKITSVIGQILGYLASWVLGSIFALLGILTIFSELLPGIIMLAMATILLPPLSKLVEQRLQTTLSAGHKIPLILIGMVLFSWSVEKKDNTPPSKLASSTQTTISIPSIPTNTPAATGDPADTVTAKATPTTQENTNSTPTETPTETTDTQASPQASITATPLPEQEKLLGISYNQVMRGLADTFSLENSPLRDGRTRYIGNSPNNLETLEIIGEKKNVEEITLIIFVPEEDPGLVVGRINALILIQTVFPDWSESNNWFEDARLKITKDYRSHESSRVEKVYGDISMTLSGSRLLNALTLTVKHK